MVVLINMSTLGTSCLKAYPRHAADILPEREACRVNSVSKRVWYEIWLANKALKLVTLLL